MADVTHNQWRVGRKGSGPHMEEEQGSDLFQPMEKLLETWLAGARLAEFTRVVQLTKAELARRGITLTWSIDQHTAEQSEGPCRASQPRAGA